MLLHRMVYPDRFKMLPHAIKDHCLPLRKTFLNTYGVEDDMGK